MSFTFENALSLVIATAILGLSPGPAVFATISRSISLPFRRTFLFISGIVFGDFIFAMLAMCGVALLVSEHAIYFIILKVAGGGYLIYLGMRALLAKTTITDIQEIEGESAWKLLLSGFFLTAGNPKDLLFFVSFLPAFIDLKTADPTQMLIAATLIVITFIGTLSFYAALTSTVGGCLKNPKTILWLDRMAGAILIIVGLIALFLS